MFEFLKRLFSLRSAPAGREESAVAASPETRLREVMLGCYAGGASIQNSAPIDLAPPAQSLKETMLGRRSPSTRRSLQRSGRYEASDEDGSDLPHYSTIGIEYCDANGEETRRIVTIRAIENHDDGHATLFCFCHLRQDMRDFRVDRVANFYDPDTGELLTRFAMKAHDGPLPSFDGASACTKPPAPQTIDEIFSLHSAELAALGWAPLIDKTETGESLGLHKIGKRGKLLKSPVIAISFEAFHYEYVAGDDGTVEQRKGGPRLRPWCVRANGLQTRTWGFAEPATAAFVEAARALAATPR